ncbi:cell division protein ZapE [Salinibacterium sp. SYSU T00001]|uniref:cell division protein ZapE n=1 Tax=Homoserinimonas sedimenticola TaxID=2986805 RepID=UPI00223648E8|nr:cell division protein ZapE [Salinibacterium sedimenticola]MCW4384307.1 cell division protein ZapE [Salinibacterium sedimenticola]
MTPEKPSSATSAPTSLLNRDDRLSGREMVEHLVPPRQFMSASLDNYRPDPDFPSQAEAVEAVRIFASGAAPRRGGLFSRRKPSEEVRPGIYLDGGFGVGKTHLLASLWHLARGRKYFGTFIEYTALVGALGYADTVKALKGASLLCIDEFELDDPGDTRLMARLLGELVASGSRIAATSNTPPNALGEGRFAAQDFLREIDALAGQFTTIRVDGVDYRHRENSGHAVTTEPAEVRERLAALGGDTTVDDFDAVLGFLGTVHPSRYVKVVEGLVGLGLLDVHPFTSQTDALRFVAFVDRLYDAQVRVVASGTALDEVFPEEMLSGGYRKKYLRAVSRLIALTSDQRE